MEEADRSRVIPSIMCSSAYLEKPLLEDRLSNSGGSLWLDDLRKSVPTTMWTKLLKVVVLSTEIGLTWSTQFPCVLTD